ncbi:hypothetical protein LMG28614_06377 [Paraburkholderia ultramafica]|uniref:Uncharacterized protein n=1 Tax=Paraburkholderia ultramafica TaxID=1544867 RepID=A0A6S7BN05_9BURK|nr:hypothetical protein LMG28614_06377 [Paraburkholderia ultramafica]
MPCSVGVAEEKQRAAAGRPLDLNADTAGFAGSRTMYQSHASPILANWADQLLDLPAQ